MYKTTTAAECMSTRCKAEYLDKTGISDWTEGTEPEHQYSSPMQQSCQLEILILALNLGRVQLTQRIILIIYSNKCWL
jgi:hypothetical protein